MEPQCQRVPVVYGVAAVMLVTFGVCMLCVLLRAFHFCCVLSTFCVASIAFNAFIIFGSGTTCGCAGGNQQG